MAFSANRDIRVEASQSADGAYVLRTRGLAARKRPELEIAGVPEVALNAAGGVINLIADYTVNNAEVLADQNVGNVLAVGDDGRKLLLVVRAIAVEKPKQAGLWSKLVGSGDKGVLRLVDVDGDSPLTALATMLVHRAAVRLAKDDDEGARKELEAAIATLPGSEEAGAAPSIASEGALNWQNHLAYLELATIAERAGDQDEAVRWFGRALARSAELAHRELGTTPASLLDLDDATLAREAAAIVAHNLGAIHRGSGPTPALLTIASPIWEPGDDGAAARRASLMPAKLIELYYEGPAAEGLRRGGASLVVSVLATMRDRPWKAAWIARAVRGVWDDASAPLVESPGPFRPAQGLVSAMLADLARGYRAGATDDELLARYTAEAPPPTLLAKLAALEEWETEQYAAAMTL